jgi:hypothetical protein
MRGCWEIRLVRIAQDAAPAQWTLRIGGWPVASDDPPTQQEGPGTASVQANEGNEALTSRLTSRVIALHGTMLPGVHRPPGPHAFGAHAAVPYLTSAVPVQPGDTYAAAVSLSADPAAPDDPPRLTIESTEAGEVTATIIWPDGEQDELSL